MKTISFFLALLFLFPVSSNARYKIEGRDYNLAWKDYLAKDTLKTPVSAYLYEDCFIKAAEKNNLPLTLLLAVARGESFFNPLAISKKQCYGIMQIQWPQTAKDLGITRRSDLFDPCKNIQAGAKYLRRLMNRYNENLHLALAAYNYGPGRIKKESSLDSIPGGAKWYSGYIHHHLQTILKGSTGSNTLSPRQPYQKELKFEIIVFNKPYRARGFYNSIQKKAPLLQFEWFRVGPGRFQVVMLYKNTKELDCGKAVLRRLM